MDASQYKDYILTLLFVKYVSDKFTGEDYADVEVPEGGSFDDMVQLIGKKNIGEGINKVIAKLAAANNLRGVIDKVSFNDPDKLGKGDEMVKKLSKLIEIFRRPELDFSKNRAEDDDLIGDAYEYLMRKFATESGKSKGQFLNLIHNFLIFDKGQKKVCRYNQYYGIMRAQKRLTAGKGGIIWHTQGSGKSLTMIWLSKWLLANIPTARVLIVTDRDELDEQIEKNFKGVYETIVRTRSGADLLARLNSHEDRLLCSLIHKFGKAFCRADCTQALTV